MQAEPGNERSRGERPGWREILRDPAVAAILVYTVIAIVGAITAYFAIFTVFAAYDDEGTLLVSLQAFMDGGTLYKDVYSPYGPFFYEFFGGLLKLFGLSVTNDLSRSLVIIVWIVVSFTFGYSVQRLTGRLLLGAAGMIVAFASLGVLINEPMHPHGLAIMLLAVFVLLAVIGLPRGATWTGALAGAALAALVLTKVNLGAVAVAATLLAAVLVVVPFSRLRWLRWLAAAAFVLLPLVVMARDLDVAVVRELALIEMLAGAALLIAGWRLGGDTEGEGNQATLSWLLAAAAGFVVAFVAILVAIFAAGSAPSDVYKGVVTEAMRVREISPNFMGFPGSAVDWALISFAVAVIVSRFGRRETVSVWPGILRALAGLAVWYALAHVVVIGFNPSSQNPLVIPALLAWICALPPAGAVETTPKRLLRLLLPALAIAEVLTVYPVAGSQPGIAATVFVPVGGLLLADAITDFNTWAKTRDGLSVSRVGIATTVLTAALVVQLGVSAMGRPTLANIQVYSDRKALDLPGGSLLHLDPVQAEEYEKVVALIHRYGCTSFIGYANVNSLYLWSEIDPPPPAAPGAWIGATDSYYQQQAVDALKEAQKPCAIINEPIAQLWLQGKPVPDRPLANYVFDAFEPVAKVGEFEIAVPK